MQRPNCSLHTQTTFYPFPSKNTNKNHKIFPPQNLNRVNLCESVSKYLVFLNSSATGGFVANFILNLRNLRNLWLHTLVFSVFSVVKIPELFPLNPNPTNHVLKLTQPASNLMQCVSKLT
jgi:hypothetical protein